MRFRPAISPTLFEEDWLPVRDCHVPLTVSFLSCHAWLTENKVSVNGTGQGLLGVGRSIITLQSKEEWFETSNYSDVITGQDEI